MEDIKYTDGYIKSMCVMISRGDILDIDSFLKYLEYADLENPIKASSFELDMLFGSDNLHELNPKYYTDERFYSPVDLILYSCISSSRYSFYKKELLSKIIEIKSLDFSNLSKTLEHVVSKGDLELFNLFVGLKPNFNIVHTYLKNGMLSSVLDNCLSLAMARLTINDKDKFFGYPKEILEYLLSINKDNIDFELMKVTRTMGASLLEISEIGEEYPSFYSDVDTNLLEEVDSMVKAYRDYKINTYYSGNCFR